MARMLQALKNLEARSAKTPGQGWLAHLAEKPPQPESQGATLVMPPAAAVAIESSVQVEEPRPASARPARRADATPIAREIESAPAVELAPAVVTAPAIGATAAVAAVENTPDVQSPWEDLPFVEDAKQSITPLAMSPPAPWRVESAKPSRKLRPLASGRNPSSLERQVRRTLSDPVRSQPLEQLADRLRRDAEHTASKTLLFVGIGEESRAHEALLYAAALLAEKHGEQVLLIDADLARRSLTEGLEQGQMPGLAEVVRSNELPSERHRPMALPDLTLLPAGLLRHVDLSAAGPRLEEVLRQAAENHSLVLIDGGRSGDLAAGALARLADATYFVVQLGAVETSEAQAALRDFRAASARVLGCIAT